MPGRVNYTTTIGILDKANTVSTIKLFVSEADAADYVATPTGAVAVNTLQSAVEALSIGNVERESGGVVQSYSPATPTDDQAYNSAKLTVFMADATSGDKFRFSIPARNTANYNTFPGTKNVILTIALGGTAAVEALVTAAEATVISENGNSMTVQRIVISGRKQA
jgi:hypothetical protein